MTWCHATLSKVQPELCLSHAKLLEQLTIMSCVLYRTRMGGGLLKSAVGSRGPAKQRVSLNCAWDSIVWHIAILAILIGASHRTHFSNLRQQCRYTGDICAVPNSLCNSTHTGLQGMFSRLSWRVVKNELLKVNVPDAGYKRLCCSSLTKSMIRVVHTAYSHTLIRPNEADVCLVSSQLVRGASLHPCGLISHSSCNNISLVSVSAPCTSWEWPVTDQNVFARSIKKAILTPSRGHMSRQRLQHVADEDFGLQAWKIYERFSHSLQLILVFDVQPAQSSLFASHHGLWSPTDTLIGFKFITKANAAYTHRVQKRFLMFLLILKLSMHAASDSFTWIHTFKYASCSCN